MDYMTEAVLSLHLQYGGRYDAHPQDLLDCDRMTLTELRARVAEAQDGEPSDYVGVSRAVLSFIYCDAYHPVA